MGKFSIESKASRLVVLPQKIQDRLELPLGVAIKGGQVRGLEVGGEAGHRNLGIDALGIEHPAVVVRVAEAVCGLRKIGARCPKRSEGLASAEGMTDE
ncbi:MAG: hypothetical protein ACI8W8_004917, partial [Rhodothermales bacterium]